MANLINTVINIIVYNVISTDTVLSVKQKTDGKISIRHTVNLIFVLIKQSSREVNPKL